MAVAVPTGSARRPAGRTRRRVGHGGACRRDPAAGGGHPGHGRPPRPGPRPGPRARAPLARRPGRPRSAATRPGPRRPPGRRSHPAAPPRSPSRRPRPTGCRSRSELPSICPSASSRSSSPPPPSPPANPAHRHPPPTREPRPLDTTPTDRLAGGGGGRGDPRRVGAGGVRAAGRGGGVDVGALAGARAAAQTAADMAALAALTPRPAGPAERGEDRAAEIAAANGAELVACDCSAVEAVVSVRRRQRLVPGWADGGAHRQARAVLGQPGTAGRATVRAGDLSRAVDGDQATRRDPATGDAAGRPARQCQRGDGGGAVRSVGGRGPGRGPRRAAHQPRGPPDGPGRAAAGGGPAGGRAGTAADQVGAAAPVRAAGSGAVRGLPADVQHRAPVHRGVAGSGDAGHHADLERAAGEDRRRAPGPAPGRRRRVVGGRASPWPSSSPAGRSAATRMRLVGDGLLLLTGLLGACTA